MQARRNARAPQSAARQHRGDAIHGGLKLLGVPREAEAQKVLAAGAEGGARRQADFASSISRITRRRVSVSPSTEKNT